MNRLTNTSIIMFCLLMLSGCVLDEDKDNNKTHQTNNQGHTPTVVINDDDKDDETDNPSPTSCDANPSPIKKFIRVQLTYGLLDAAAYVPTETGGLLPITITSPANKGDTVIQVASTTALVNDQLLTYLGTDAVYRVGQVASTTANTITLKEPLVESVDANDSSLWNFYNDATHPNEVAYKAIADFSFNSAFDVLQPNKVHMLLGDSWFKSETTAFADRLEDRLPSGSLIKNEGRGGQNLCSLLARVDDAIDTHNPNYVWINSSVNDYFAGVTQEDYKARMQTLINKVQSVGAIAIVLDPAPGMPNQSTADGTTFTTLSHRYATQILNLLSEAE